MRIDVVGTRRLENGPMKEPSRQMAHMQIRVEGGTLGSGILRYVVVPDTYGLEPSSLTHVMTTEEASTYDLIVPASQVDDITERFYQIAEAGYPSDPLPKAAPAEEVIYPKCYNR